MQHAAHAEVPDYKDARDLVETLLEELWLVDPDHPDTPKGIKIIDDILKVGRRPTG